MKWVFSIHLFLLFSYCDSLTYLCKTKETFKLAELQWLEVELNAVRHCEIIDGNQQQPYYVTKLLVDRATGSTLFRLETETDKDGCHSLFQHHCLSPSAPTSLQKCDWIAQVVCSEDSAEKLVMTLQEAAQPETLDEIIDDWGLGYIRVEGGGSDGNTPRPTMSYTKTSLLQSVAHALPVPPALDPRKTKQELLVVDTFCDSDNSQCYLGIQQNIPSVSNPSILKDWSKRPFQYSSAINPQVAESIMDILWNMLQDSDRPEPLALLDPTCGSGTFLALAMGRGMRVEAYDYNQQCVDGSQRNMEYIFAENDDNVLTRLQVNLHDSTNPFPTSKDGHTIDCVIANLPWGVNTVDYANQNANILKSVRNRIDSNIPCAFVTRDSDIDLFVTNGFQVLGQAHVPQRGFQLPKGSKKKKDAKELERNGRNHCVVTIARVE